MLIEIQCLSSKSPQCLTIKVKNYVNTFDLDDVRFDFQYKTECRYNDMIFSVFIQVYGGNNE